MSEPLTDRLVSPNGFDGYGTVPDKVNEAARKIARLRTTFVNQWVPGADGTLTTTEIDRLFDASAIQAEWMRELYEARDTLTTQLAEMTRERDESNALLHVNQDAHKRCDVLMAELGRKLTAAEQRVKELEDVVDAVRQWGEYTPRRVARALTNLPTDPQEDG